ncbi:hypothetical protein HDV04_000914 [Boothiomyces sp. JEL0838]|nr:hypothetical protein HDV04_000865 [Boothiomyces sp. JEL0838]KAJ3314191.1 hypothetical protein HDV04_000914 [Boothiomyces sp. JEL0838]
MMEQSLQVKEVRSNASPSLRSFPPDALANTQLPPIPYTQKPLLVTPLGANPQEQYRLKADYGSIGSICDLPETEIPHNPESLAFKVCQHCQTSLLGAFEHCLAKNGEPINFASSHQINEEADGVLSSEMPYFDIIKDPTQGFQKPLFNNPKEQIERNNWVLHQSKQKNTKLDIRAGGTVKGLGIQSGKNFSGTLYKRMLDAKDKEINQLRAHLYETAKREKAESVNVKKLKNALSKSVNYYVFAEEWQKSESARLQDDIRHLKSEISSLMAFLINSEVEKQALLKGIKDLNAVIKEKEDEAKKSLAIAEEMKGKLQESFKEFITMDETMVQLRKEAQKGTDAVEARNIMLQKNLARLTADFEVSAKDLRLSNSKCRELEYELEQMTTELNIKGDSLKVATATNVTLKANLEATTVELRELKKEHDRIILAKAKVEADFRADTAKNEATKAELRKSLAKVSSDLDTVTSQKMDLEIYMKANKQEIEKLTRDLQSMTEARNGLQQSLDKAQSQARAEISTRDNQIQELNKKITKDAQTLKQVQEKKEQLMFEVTDLQNNLEMETSNAKRYLEELTLVRRTAEERNNLLTEQVEKLNAAKINLSNDKKQLTEKIKTFRQDLRQKEEELDDVNKRFEEYQTEAMSEHDKLDRKLKSLQEDHRLLNKTHDSLKELHTDTVKDNLALKKDKEALLKRQNELNSDIQSAKQMIGSLTNEKDNLLNELLRWKAEYSELETKFIKSVEQYDAVTEVFEKYRQTSEDTILGKDKQIQQLTENLMDAQTQIHNLTTKNTALENTLGDTEHKLADTINKLLAETSTREILEDQLNTNRLQFHNEKRMRSELERLHSHLKYGDTSRAMSSFSEWRIRDRKLADLASGLTNEAKRLNELVNLLPIQNGFGNENDFNWPNDVPGKKKQSKPPKTPERKVRQLL